MFEGSVSGQGRTLLINADLFSLGFLSSKKRRLCSITMFLYYSAICSENKKDDDMTQTWNIWCNTAQWAKHEEEGEKGQREEWSNDRVHLILTSSSWSQLYSEAILMLRIFVDLNMVWKERHCHICSVGKLVRCLLASEVKQGNVFDRCNSPESHSGILSAHAWCSLDFKGTSWCSLALGPAGWQTEIKGWVYLVLTMLVQEDG